MQTTRHNPFIRPSALEAVMLRELVDVAAVCHQRGWTAGTAGNFSVGVRSGLLWMSPSGVNKGSLAWDRFIPIELESRKNLEALERKPSDETALHAAIMWAHEGARCVVHVHPPYIVSASQSVKPLTFVDWEMQKALGMSTHQNHLEIPCLDNTQDIDALALSMTFTSELPVLVLKGHGVYAWGSTPQRALNYIEGLEHLCQVSLSST